MIETIGNTQLLETYRANMKETDKEFYKMINNSFYFNVYLITTLPMGFMAGLKLKSITEEECKITVPYRWMNQNPFKSTYFAVLSMAAEMSTGMLALRTTYKANPSVSMLVTRVESEFVKKATGITTFTCSQGREMIEAVERAILTGEGQTFLSTSVGTSQNGEVESRFNVQWSFKARLK
ncbi:MAG TPA: DUF4442 domain-containing protein [Chitinophagales bacterium]|nr:DUF4442 domain-containing protein [Chitinophagales bacterium]